MCADRQKFTIAVDEPNIRVSTYFDDSKMSIITEVPCVNGVPPESFVYFINNWLQCVKSINPLIAEIEELEPVQGYSVGKTKANVPWPLTTRCTIAARYPCPNFKEGEHLLMLSERGAESRAILSEEEQKNLCQARLFIAGWHFSPVKTADGQIKGTKICYL